MADEALVWKFKGEDLFSGPVDRIAKTLGVLDSQLERTSSKIDKALGSGKAKVSAARGDFAKAWAGVVDIGSSLRASALGQRIEATLGNALGAVRGLGGRLAAPLGKAFEGVGALAGRIGAPLGRVFDTVMGSSLVTRARGLLTSVGGIVTGIGGKLAPVFGPLASGFKNIIGAAGDFGGALASKVMPLLKSLGGIAGGAVLGIAAIGTAMAAASVSLIGAAGKWALSGLAFKEDSITAFKTMLGTQQAAERVFTWANDFAANTPFQTEDVVQQVQKLLVGGFKENQLDTLMKALGDVGANMGKEKMGQVSTGLVQIKAKGKLQGEEMMQLAEAGVGQSAIFEALSRNLGISVGAAKAKVSGGQVSGEQGVAAVLEAIRVTQSGGTFGGAMEAKSKTLTGLMSSLEDIPKNLLFKADTGGLLAPIKALMDGIIKAFDKGKPLFNQGIAMFEHIGRAWGDAFGALGSGDVEGVLGGIMRVTEEFFTAAAPFAKGFFPELMKQVETLLTTMGLSGDAKSIQETGKSVAQALGIIANGVVLLAKALGFVVKAIAGALDALGLGPKLWGQLADLATTLNGTSAEADQASIEEHNRKMAEVNAYKASKGLPVRSMVDGFTPPTGATAAAVANLDNFGNVAAVNVFVTPDDAEAGKKIANAARGSLIDQIKGFANELAG